MWEMDAREAGVDGGPHADFDAGGRMGGFSRTGPYRSLLTRPEGVGVSGRGCFFRAAGPTAGAKKKCWVRRRAHRCRSNFVPGYFSDLTGEQRVIFFAF